VTVLDVPPVDGPPDAARAVIALLQCHHGGLMVGPGSLAGRLVQLGVNGGWPYPQAAPYRGPSMVGRMTAGVGPSDGLWIASRQMAGLGRANCNTAACGFLGGAFQGRYSVQVLAFIVSTTAAGRRCRTYLSVVASEE